MSPAAPQHHVNPAEAIAVFSHNLLNDVSRIAGLVHLLDMSRRVEVDEARACEYLHQLTLRSEQLVRRLQRGLGGLAPQPHEPAKPRWAGSRSA